MAQSDTENHRFHLGRSYEELGHVYKEQNRLEKAIDSYRQAEDVWAKLVEEFHHPDRKAHLSWTKQWIADVLILQARQVFADVELTDVDRKAKIQELRAQALGLLRDTAPASGSANNTAWQLATDPNPDLRDPALAVEFAKLAVERAKDDEKGKYSKTLGVAQFRAGQWQLAIESLQESMELRKGGDAVDWFFLAMAHWQLGQKDDARNWYEKGVEWTKKNAPHNEELLRFQREAADLIESVD